VQDFFEKEKFVKEMTHFESSERDRWQDHITKG
jgi:hypothetical protein